jgi:hypothetical protein
MSGIAAGLGKLAGKGVGVAAQGAAGVAGATTGFVGGIISPVLKFFSDIIKQRVAAADEAGRKREARDEKIVAICEAIWKEPIAKEVARAPPGSYQTEGALLQIENPPRISEELALRSQDQ